MAKARKPTLKKVCNYTERKNRLNKLLVNRSVNKDNSNNEEIEKLKAQIDYFEWGIVFHDV